MVGRPIRVRWCRRSLPFGVPRQLFCPGRPDIIQDIDGVLANYFSTSFAAPHLFGDRRAQFEDVLAHSFPPLHLSSTSIKRSVRAQLQTFAGCNMLS